jgi:hypothetical protein
MGPCLMLADDLRSNLPRNKVQSNQPSIHGEMTFVQHDDIGLSTELFSSVKTCKTKDSFKEFSQLSYAYVIV